MCILGVGEPIDAVSPCITAGAQRAKVVLPVEDVGLLDPTPELPVPEGAPGQNVPSIWGLEGTAAGAASRGEKPNANLLLGKFRKKPRDLLLSTDTDDDEELLLAANGDTDGRAHQQQHVLGSTVGALYLSCLSLLCYIVQLSCCLLLHT